ncbi:MAG: autotransporter domain-containing protein [Sphingomonas sp.]
MAMASIAMPQLAYAQNECGATATPTVTCTAANDPYATGVTYTALPTDFTILLNDDTVVDTSGSAHPGVQGAATGSRSLTLQGAPGSKITTDGANAHGVSLTTAGGALNATTGVIKTSGAGATGIKATSASGAVTVAGGTIATTGTGARGIDAITDSGNISVATGTVTTTGANAIGASGRSNSGNVTVTIGSIGTSGAGAIGAVARTGGSGTATVQGGTISVSGAGAVGAAVKSVNGAATANLASIKTRGVGADGLLVTSTGGTASATITRVITTGDNARGIVVSGALGASVSYNSVSTRGAGATGISVPAGTPSAKATVIGTGPLTTAGTDADGINLSATGAVTVSTAGTIATTGNNSRGIVVTGGGTVTVSAAGVTTTGTTSAGVVATSTGGTVRVVLTGANSSATSDGVTVVAATNAVVNLAPGGSLSGGANGVTITSGGATKMNNAGTLSGAVYAVVANGGAALVNNSGMLNGRIALSDNADIVNNTGVFNATGVSLYRAGNDQFNNSGTYLANADADFGAGVDSFTNTGIFRVLGASAAPGTITLAGLEAYDNSGLVDLRNGQVGDVLVLPGTYTGSGAAVLGLDVTPGVSTDQLRIGGAASGSTQVAVTIIGNGPAVLGTAATLVQAGAASSANAFTVAGGTVDQGLIQYGIVYNPTSFAYNLVGAPGVGVYRAAVFGEAARNLWLQSGDAWSGHMRTLRDTSGSTGRRGRIWAQTLGQVEQRTNSRTFTSLGITSQADLGYKQDYFGGQMGMDFGGSGGGGRFAFGFTAGYLNSNLNFARSADRMNFDDVNAGVYAGYSAGGFFLNALAKYDRYWGSNHSLTGGYSRDIEGVVYGGKAEIGYRFGKQVFIEPAASIAYTHDDMDDVTVVAGNFVFGGDDGVRGKAGARIGYVAEIDATTLSLYGGGNYVHAFEGENKVSFISGGQTVAFANGRGRDYGEVTLGLKIGSDLDKVSAFLEGRYASGGDYQGYGGRAGGQVRF